MHSGLAPLKAMIGKAVALPLLQRVLDRRAPRAARAGCAGDALAFHVALPSTLSTFDAVSWACLRQDR